MSPSSTSTNAQLAEFFRNHDHHTKLSKEEFEFVEALLFGRPASSTSNNASLLSLPRNTPSTSTMPRFNTFSASKLPVQASPFVLPSSTQKKLLFVAPVEKAAEEPIERKVLEEVQPKVVEAPIISQPVEKVSVPPVVENRQMTETAKYLMQSLHSVDEDMPSASTDTIMKSPPKRQELSTTKEELPPKPQELPSKKQESSQKLPEFKFELPKTATAPLPEFKFDLPSSNKVEAKTEAPQYKQFNFDLSEYAPSSTAKKAFPSSTTLPEFRFEF